MCRRFKIITNGHYHEQLLQEHLGTFYRRYNKKLHADSGLAFSVGVPTLQRNRTYVHPEKKLHGLSPNFHIHVSVSDYMYIPTSGPPIFLLQRRDRPIVVIYLSLIDTRMYGLRARSFISGNICFKSSVYCLCSVRLSD